MANKRGHKIFIFQNFILGCLNSGKKYLHKQPIYPLLFTRQKKYKLILNQNVRPEALIGIVFQKITYKIGDSICKHFDTLNMAVNLLMNHSSLQDFPGTTVSLTTCVVHAYVLVALSGQNTPLILIITSNTRQDNSYSLSLCEILYDTVQN